MTGHGPDTAVSPLLSVDDHDDPPREPADCKHPSSGRRRAALFAVAAGAVSATVLAGMTYVRDTAPPEPAAQERLPPGTERIARGNLVTEVVATGALTYSGTRAVNNHLTGIVTWVPAENTVVAQGKRLYAVNNVPVFLMRGSLPAWREFKPGMPDGTDVRMLEQNLAELGYTGFTVDDKFSEKTEAAVKRWQKNTGLAANGKIELGRVVFAPGSVRIAGVKVRSGDSVAPAQDVLQVTGFRHSVSAEVPAKEQDLAVKGANVDIEFPDGERSKGTVASVGAEKTKEDGTKVVPITVRPETSRKLDTLQSAEIVVVLKRTEATDVLSVPVTALLPAEGGGYAVQLVKKGKVFGVKVKTGAFADGRAEISGAGLSEGQLVGVPKL
ncbi:peptidoglycan-binding protein [Streptomyces sp. NPDC048350]|uniref:peptidoglycan-binding protein n=1 Tax=Streptomyces sp. NPDC048350 TaxID=3365538 RepID=UPI00371256B6